VPHQPTDRSGGNDHVDGQQYAKGQYTANGMPILYQNDQGQEAKRHYSNG